MKTYEVTINEHSTTIYLVNAQNEETALSIGRRRYEEGDASDIDVASDIDSIEAAEVISPKVKRVAVVTSGARDAEQVKRYMPSNYHVRVRDGVIFIEGEDVQGWNMAYVLGRLSSALINAVEVKVQP